MQDLLKYVCVVLSVALGAVVISRRFLKQTQTREFNLKTRVRDKEKNEIPLQERINFRRKPFPNHETSQATPRKISLRQEYNQATQKEYKNKQLYLNKTFWMVLAVLILLFLILIDFNWAIFTA